MSRPEPVPDRPLRFAAYVRVSKVGDRGDELMSPDIQTAAARQWCDQHGHELTKVVEDIDQSGRSWKPRQIGALVDEVAAGDLDGIVVWKWSRFARDRLDWAVHVDRVESAGGQLASATEDVDLSTSAGRFTRGMLAELAAFESERIGESWREVHRRRWDEGLQPTGRPPFGWRKLRGHRDAEPDPVTAPIVAELYRRYIGGASVQVLADWLRDTGVSTSTGAPWHPQTVTTLLDNPRHAGLIRLNGATRRAAQPGIIDAATWEMFGAARRDRRRIGRPANTPYLLTGLLVCTACEHRMGGGGGRQYRCLHAARTRVHPFSSITVRRVDPVVLAWLSDRADGINRAAQNVPAPLVLAADMDALAGRIAELDRKLGALTVRLLDGTVPESAYAVARDNLMAQRGDLESARQAEQDRRALAPAAPSREAFDLREHWDELPLSDKRAGLRALIREVRVTLGPDLRVDIVEA